MRKFEDEHELIYELNKVFRNYCDKRNCVDCPLNKHNGILTKDYCLELLHFSDDLEKEIS